MPDTLRRVELVDADLPNASGAARLLLEDFADALCAYARMGKSEVPTVAWADSASSPADDTDALVAAFTVQGATLPDRAIDMLDAIAAHPVPLYALCATDSHDPADALAALDELDRRCADAGIPWRGGVIVGGGALIARTAKSPRMGTLRRWRSEATDALIAAVRLGASVEEAAQITRDTTRVRQGNVILARCPIPKAAYRLLCR